MPRKKSEPLKPLQRFDYTLVSAPLEGLFRNIDRDLQRRDKEIIEAGDSDSDRCLVLLHVIVRFAWNSYCAVVYVAGNIPEDPRRKPSYALIVPNVNRQLLDILFSLAYMLDDFSVRSLAYQQAGWRDLLEESKHFKRHFGKDKRWKAHFKNMDAMLAGMVGRYKITPNEQKTPNLVPYWPTPYQLLEKKTACRASLKYLETWLYKDTSAQTHLGFGGMLKVSHFSAY
jgi:hypothetical protein